MSVSDALRYPFVQRALLEVLLLATAAGLLGTWIVLRRLAFYSHAVGTAAFPGLVLADGLGFPAAVGAFVAALAFAAGMARLVRGGRAQDDSMTALALVGALVLGVILASDVFHSGSNIETLLFGSLLLIGTRDLVFAALVSIVVLASTLTLGRRWLAYGFDSGSMRALGLRSNWPETALLVLIALTVTAALSIAGALLATALLVIPAATTRLWIRKLVPWQVATVIAVALEGSGGLWISLRTNAPPGATIATLAGAVFAVALGARWLRDRVPRRAAVLAAGLVLGLVATACGASSPQGANGRLVVVATTTQIADWVRNVGGDAVDVHQILQPNTDPHDYEPRPEDVTSTADASVVFLNGDNLDAWMPKVISDSGGTPMVVDLGTDVPDKLPGETSGPEASQYDPHWWHDPANAEEAITRIQGALVRADPAKKKTFEANASAYLAKLKTLDAGVEKCMDEVPVSERKLVTDHDAFDYFAKRYDIDVVGAVIPSLTTQAQASAGELASLVQLIRAEHVQAVYPESSLSPKLVQTIARETGASADYTLYGDALGPADTPGATYLSMEAANADAMVRGFSGGALHCTIPGIS